MIRSFDVVSTKYYTLFDKLLRFVQEKETGRPPTHDEVFLRTHQKKNKKWIFDYARETYESFKTKEVDHITQVTQQGSTPLTPRQLWTDHVGVKKGCIYDLGSSVSTTDIGYDRKNTSGSASSGMQHMMDEMRHSIREEVRQEVTQELRKKFEERECCHKSEISKMVHAIMRGEFNVEDVEVP